MENKTNVRMISPLELFANSYRNDMDYTVEEDDLLYQSVAEHGVVEPILVKNRNGKLEVLSGIRRWKAAKLAGVSKIPVIQIHVCAEIISSKDVIMADGEYDAIEYNEDESYKRTFLKIFNRALERDQHVIKIPLCISVESFGTRFDMWDAIKEFGRLYENYDLDILFCMDEVPIKYTEYISSINHELFYDYIYPVEWKGWNDWKPFGRNIWAMQIKKEGESCARLWDVDEDREILISLEDGVTFERFHDAIGNFDRSDWIIGLDYQDIKNTLFAEDNDRDVFFFEWPKVTIKTIADLNSFLFNNNKKMVSILFWGYKGVKATYDVAEILCIYADCDYVIQYCDGVFDDERETIHALCICEPGKNELDISDSAVNGMPVVLTPNGNEPEFTEPDFRDESDLTKKGIICEEKMDYKRALNYYRRAIDEQDSAEAYYRMGVMYYDGNWFVKADKPKGVRFFEMAYEKGFDNFRSGDLLMMGSYRQYEVEEGRKYGLKRNMNLAIRYYKKMIITEVERNISRSSIENGYSHLGAAYLEDEVLNYKKAYQYLKRSGCKDEKSKYYMGYLYEFGYYVKQDLEKAMELFNEILRISQTGELYYNLALDELKKIKSVNADGKKYLEIDNLRKQSCFFRVERDWGSYVDVLKRIFDLTKDDYPDYDACYKLSWFYYCEAEKGRCDYRKAFFYDNLLAEKGDKEAKLRIVGRYNSGFYEKERERAKQYLAELEKEDYKPAYIFLGCDYQYGNMLLEKNIEKALMYYEKAGMAGNKVGYEFLGEMYYKGIDVKKDYGAAYIYLEGCRGEFEFPDSFFILADLYDRGLGTKYNMSRARYNYQKGIEKWEALYAGMSESELEENCIDVEGYKKAKEHLR